MFDFLTDRKFVSLFSFVLGMFGTAQLARIVLLEQKFSDVVTAPLIGANPSKCEMQTLLWAVAFLSVLRFEVAFKIFDERYAAAAAVCHAVFVAVLTCTALVRVIVPAVQAGTVLQGAVVLKTVAHMLFGVFVVYVYWNWWRKVDPAPRLRSVSASPSVERTPPKKKKATRSASKSKK